MNFTDFVVITNILDKIFEKELKSRKKFHKAREI